MGILGSPPAHPAMPAPLRAAVCDRQALVARDLLRSACALGFESAGIALTLDAAHALVAQDAPDLVLLDAQLGPAAEVEALADELWARRVAVVRLTTGDAGGPCDLAKPVAAGALHGAVEATLLARALADPVAPAVLGAGAVDRVLGHLRREHARPVALPELAALVGMAPFPFARAYHAAAGSAPHDTLVACRVEAAERLLRTTDWGPTQVALEVGFGGRRAFEAAFVETTGVAPADYRAACEAFAAGRSGS